MSGFSSTQQHEIANLYEELQVLGALHASAQRKYSLMHFLLTVTCAALGLLGGSLAGLFAGDVRMTYAVAALAWLAGVLNIVMGTLNPFKRGDAYGVASRKYAELAAFVHDKGTASPTSSELSYMALMEEAHRRQAQIREEAPSLDRGIVAQTRTLGASISRPAEAGVDGVTEADASFVAGKE